MSLLLESIRIQNQTIYNHAYHQSRILRSQEAHYPYFETIDVQKIVQPYLSSLAPDTVYKCRLLYAQKVEKIAFMPYRRRLIRSLQIVVDDPIDYAYKWENRTALNRLWQQRGTCDDVLIVKNGWVTDTSYCTILFGKKGAWFTPDTPLLKGTQRAYLITQKKIQVCPISVHDIASYEVFKLVNAMLPFEEAPAQPVSQIQQALR